MEAGTCRPTNEPFCSAFTTARNTIRNRSRVAGWVTRHAARLGWPRVSHRGPRGARSPGVPRHGLRGGPAPGRPRDLRGGPRRGLRRPAAAPPRRSRRAAGPRQRPGRDGRGPRGAARRGDLHVLGHRGGAPRPPRAPPRRRAPRRHHRAHRRRALGGPAGRGLDAGSHPLASPSTPRRGSSSTPSTSRTPRSWPASRPTTRSAPCSPWPSSPRGSDGVPALRRRLRLGRPARPSRRLVRARRVGATSGAAPRASASWSSDGARGGASPTRRTTGPPSARAASRTCPAILAAAAALRAVVDDAGGRERCVSTPWSTASAPWWRGLPEVEVVGLGGRPAAAPGDVLLPLRRRRGAGDRAGPAGFRGGERVGVHVVGARAEPRPGRDGRAHPRQRAGLGRPRRPAPTTSSASWRCCPACSTT